MLTNSPLPDIVQGDKNRINESAVEGAFIPLDELIDQYAPNIKRVLEEHPGICGGERCVGRQAVFYPEFI